MKKRPLLYIVYFLLILYLLVNTGIASDEFVAIDQLKDKSFVEMAFPRNLDNFREFIDTPLQHFTHYIWYSFFRMDSSVADSIFKVLYICLSFYLISRFFLLYAGRRDALLMSFLFLFFPSHDSTVYCFMIQYLTLSFAFYLYAFYLAERGRLILSFLSAAAASFVSYGSPAIAWALFLLFALNKEFKKGLVLLIPNIIYSFYYIFITKGLGAGSDRLAEGLGLGAIMKLFLMQVFSFIDAVAGPSMWLKIYYSFGQLSALSIAAGIALTALFYRKYRAPAGRYNGKLIFSLAVLTVLSFAMFAFTGRYPQIAFNLGNRVTIFGSLLIAYLIVVMPLPHKLRTLVFGVMIFTVLGISDHWKNWNTCQKEVINRIKMSRALKEYRGKRVVYVSGNQYSKFGPLSHIEFLSEEWVTRSIFNLLFDRRIKARPINKRYSEEDGYLVDRKYSRRYKLKDYIVVYDSERDMLFRMDEGKINEFISCLPAETRHWLQAVDIGFIKEKVLGLNPALKYAF